MYIAKYAVLFMKLYLVHNEFTSCQEWYFSWNFQYDF